MPATLLDIQGEVAVLPPSASSWQSARAGEEIAVHTRIRTGSGSFAGIALADGSWMRVAEDSEIHLTEHVRDPDNETRRTRIALLLGELYVEIKPLVNDRSSFHIDAGGAIVATRGARMHISADKSRTVRLSVFEDAAEITAGGTRVHVPANSGVIARENRRPSPPIALSRSPVLLSPAPNLTTAVQQIAFSWAPGTGPTALTYRIEIARDSQFVHVVQTGGTSQASWTSGVLEPGSYLARVVGFNRNGLAGSPSEVRAFTVVRDLRIGIRLSRPGLEKEGAIVVGPQHEFIPYALSDDTSVVSFEARVGDQDFRPLQGGYGIRREGTRTVSMRGIGADGARGEEVAMTVLVDACPPATFAKIGNARPCAIGTYIFTVELMAEDDNGVDAIEYSINDRPFAKYAGPFELNTVRQNKLRFRAIDRLGNVTDERVIIFPPALVNRR